MNNNINNDINRFDGKYLKCIISKYPSVINFLANSGSMIILQPQNDICHKNVKETVDLQNNETTVIIKNEDTQRNYIYLGNEFLASGYGFSTVDYRDSGERIIRTYDANIKNLKKADDDESKTRKNEDQKLWENFNKYVSINGGPIENTIVNINGTRGIKTKDIILYGEEAKYDDFEVENVIIKLYDHNSISYTVKDGEVIFPYGAIVSRIEIEIICKDNDSGGLNYLEVLHDFKHKDFEYDDNEGIIVKYDCDVDNQILNDNIDIRYNSHIIFYSKQLNNSLYELIIDDVKENVIKDIYLYIKKTPSLNYKYYPNLLNCTYINSTEHVKLISTGNAIKDHKIDLGTKLKIKPQYYIQYNFNGNVLSLQDFNDDNVKPLMMIDENNVSQIKILLNSGVYQNFNVAVPSNFSLRKFYLVKNNIHKFNLTGGVYKSKSSVIMPCPKSKQAISDNDICYCMSYDIYSFNSSKQFDDNISIELEITYNETNQIGVIQYTKANVNNNFINSASIKEYINDEEFNMLYWINADIYDNNTLINKLNQAKENGIKHN